MAYNPHLVSHREKFQTPEKGNTKMKRNHLLEEESYAKKIFGADGRRIGADVAGYTRLPESTRSIFVTLPRCSQTKRGEFVGQALPETAPAAASLFAWGH